MKKNKKLTFKGVNLGGLSKQIFDYLCINPTTKYVVKRSGKSKAHVGKILKKLCDKKYIKRIGRGLYLVNLNKRAQTQVNLNEQETTKRRQQNKKEKDYLRLHFTQIEINIPGYIHENLKNSIFQRKVFKNIRSSGNNGGMLFDVEGSHHTYCITNKKLILYFSDNYDIKADTVKELDFKLYNAIMEELDILRVRYKINCFKDGRINFHIFNMHIALVKNGIAHWSRKHDKKNIVYYDEEDFKPRVIMDFSNMLDELELVHPKKARDDSEEMQKAMGHIVNGNFNDLIDVSKSFFDMTEENSLSQKEMAKVMYAMQVQMKQMNQAHLNTQSQLEVAVKTINLLLNNNVVGKDPSQTNLDPKEKPDYVG